MVICQFDTPPQQLKAIMFSTCCMLWLRFTSVKCVASLRSDAL